MNVLQFFREDMGAVVSAYCDGDKLYVVRLTEKFETVEVELDGGSEFERLAEQIAQVCKQKGWATSAVGFCLRAEDAVTFQTEVGNVPAKEIPALVKSWAFAQAGDDAVCSFVNVGEELWMETMPRAKVKAICTVFKKFNLNLRGLSVMPVDTLAKVHPYDRTEFISEVVRDKKAPNLLQGGGVWSWKRISIVAAAICFIALLIGSAKIFIDYRTASEGLNAAKSSFETLREDVAIKQAVDANIAELHRLNRLAAQIDAPNNFNLLINLGKLADGSIHLTNIRLEDNFMELEGVANNPDALRNYLARVKETVVKSAQLESSAENDNGEIIFTIRAAL